mmetsp:Transcript_2845/g.10019  ORF Transcript_2845/g.10019 Transcript_2845/m.10019 type:complete len:283 (+) Transcript_2845:1787-2635(+)
MIMRYTRLVTSSVISSTGLLPSPKVTFSSSMSARTASEYTPPLMFSARYMRKSSFRSFMRLSATSLLKRLTGPTPAATVSSPSNCFRERLYSSSLPSSALATSRSRARVRCDTYSDAVFASSTTCSTANAFQMSAASSSASSTCLWNARASCSCSRPAVAAPSSSSLALYSLPALSRTATATCASVRSNTRFHGRRNLDLASPKTYWLRNTSLENSLLASISASLSPSSILVRNRRRPTSMCTCAAVPSSMPRASLKRMRASPSHPSSGVPPGGSTPWRYTS